MITNERQRRVAVGEKKRFEQAIARARSEGPGADVHPVLHDAMIAGMDSQLADLNAELSAYDALRAGQVKRRKFHSIGEFPTALIEGRIAAGLTQKALARRIGVSEQQIQRYEQTRYRAASLERLESVADALKLTVRESIEYHFVGGGASGRRAVRPKAIKGAAMAGRATGKRAASAAGKTLRSSAAGKQAKSVAASDLAQVGNRKTTGKKAASAAGKTLRAKGSSKAAKTAAASDLSQAVRRKKH